MQLDTRGGKFPECKDVEFRITDVPELQDDETSWLFNFTAEVDGVKKTYKERFWPERMKDLALAIGFKESVPGVFDWEPTKCMGRTVKADIEHQVQTKGKNAGNSFPRMVNIRRDEIPF